MSKGIDIDAYFERIGFAGSIAPSLETLEQLQLLHTQTIPFENLDPLLGSPVRLDLRNVQQKLVFDRRGGYCFEHNLLFKAVLDDLGYYTHSLAARVLWNHPDTGEERPLSHMVLTVDLGGASYLTDVGFGGLTLTGPIRLRSETEQKTPHETFRLLGGEPDWRLEVQIDGEWKPLYSFDQTEQTLEDYERFNDVVAADSHFRDNLLAARSGKQRRLGLRNTRLNIHPAEGPTETRLLTTVAEIKEVLSVTFGITLPAAERLDPVLERILERGEA